MASEKTHYRIVGIGKCTKGIKHRLTSGEPVVIGRQSGCTIVVTRTPQSDAEFEYISRQHAVIEEGADRHWFVHDNGSMNGTSILKAGLPPAVRLAAGTPSALQNNDVIELADCADFRFAYQTVPPDEEVYCPDVEGKTSQLLAASHTCLQLVHRGTARQVVELDEHGVTIGSLDARLPSKGRWLPIPGLDTPDVVATVSLQKREMTMSVEAGPLMVNLKKVRPGSTVPLKDRDLLSFPGIDDTCVLFLDQRHVSVRNLSDLLAGADEMTIGTAPDNSCRLIDPSLSKHHAKIWRDQGSLFIRDIGSTNGTTVNGRRIFDTERLQAGVPFTLGRLPFVADGASWHASGHTPSSVDVRFVGVSVKIAGKLRLHSVSFGVKQGEMIGLLGPSASGKSTLLKLLAAQYRLAAGEVYVNGRPMSQNQQRWNWLSSFMGFRDETYEVGFVQQIDLIQPGLTVREILEYAARQMGLEAQAADRAKEAANLCNLGPLMDRIALRDDGQLNLSGGQLKRVCVGLEVLRQPKILVLDEPTTGQDPKNTDDLMRLFRSLAQQGVTLLLSTHDLRNLTFFDKVAALCLGRLVYYGPPTSFAQHFDAPSAEHVYESLPDREERAAEALELEERFKTTAHYRQYCEVKE